MYVTINLYHLHTKRYRKGSVMTRISEEKLKAPFERFDVLDIDYVQQAKEVALKISRGEHVASEEIEKIRLAAVNDRKHLKGDFVISMFLDLVESGVNFNRWEGGKMIHTNRKEVEKVYHNHFSGELSVTEFCRRNAMTRNKYYRILNCNVKHEAARERLQAIKMEIEKEYHM